MADFLLFLSAFGAATLLPLQSEAVLFSMFVLQQHPVVLLLWVATLGNVLGSCANWWLGLQIEYLKHKKWFPVSAKQLEKAQKIYHRYGFLFLTAKLGTDHWGSHYLNCRCPERKFLAFCNSGHFCESRTLFVYLFTLYRND